MLAFVYLGTAPSDALEQPRPSAPRGRKRARAQSRCATSLNVRSSGPRRPITMRLIEAGSRCVRQATSGPAPSAQATAALIGETWLTTTTVVSRASSHRSSHAACTRTRQVSERLAARRRERHVHPSLLPDGFGHLRHPHPVELAVVELAHRSSTSTGKPNISAVSTARRSGLDTTRSGGPTTRATRPACSTPRRSSGGSLRPSSRPAAFASVRPWRTTTSTDQAGTVRNEPRCGRTARSTRSRREALAGSARPPSQRVWCGIRCIGFRRTR